LTIVVEPNYRYGFQTAELYLNPIKDKQRKWSYSIKNPKTVETIVRMKHVFKNETSDIESFSNFCQSLVLRYIFNKVLFFSIRLVVAWLELAVWFGKTVFCVLWQVATITDQGYQIYFLPRGQT